MRDPLPGCDSCHHRSERHHERQRVILVGESRTVEYRGETYHEGELVFRRSDTRGEAWGVGIVMAFHDAGVEVQLCSRMKDRGGFEVSYLGHQPS